MKTIRILSISESPKFKWRSMHVMIEKYRYITGVDVETDEKILIRIGEKNIGIIVDLEGKLVSSIRIGDIARIDDYTVGRYRLERGMRQLFNQKVFKVMQTE